MQINSINNVLVSRFQSSSVKRQNYVMSPMKADTVSFSSKAKTKKLDVDMETANHVAKALSTSTSGYRAEYGTDKFNKDIVEVLSLGVADYAIEAAKIKGEKPVVMIGGDTRKATQEMIPFISEVLTNKGIDVIKANKPTPTPVFAQAAKDKGIPLSILMTASHNPWSDGGYNLVTDAGAIAPPEVTEQVAKHIVANAEKGEYEVSAEKGKIKVQDLYPKYKKDLDNLKDINIDWKAIKDANIKIYYDGLRGTGNNVFPRLMKDNGIKNLTKVDSGKKTGPNPTAANLKELSELVKSNRSKLVVGLANDGDADRFGVIDENGKFITPNDVILLTAYHLSKNKGLSGAIIRSQATTGALDQFAMDRGIEVIQTPVGFKYIGEDIIKERAKGKDILVAGEESGGLTVAGHIPEKDGIIALSLMLDLMAAEKKPISEILKDAKSSMHSQVDIVAGDQSYKPGEKDLVMKRIDGFYNQVLTQKETKISPNFEVDVEKTRENEKLMKEYKKGGDGYKLYMTDGSSILIRKSGTEDKIKEYVEVVSDKNLSSHHVRERVAELKSVADNLIRPISQ